MNHSDEGAYSTGPMGCPGNRGAQFDASVPVGAKCVGLPAGNGIETCAGNLCGAGNFWNLW